MRGMKITWTTLAVGIALGAASWMVVPLVSEHIEPFDSAVGLGLGQLLMSIVAFYIGFTRGIRVLLILLLGLYLGMNAYPYVFGTAEQRAWAVLGLIMNVAMCVLPFCVGLIGRLVKAAVTKRRHQCASAEIERGNSKWQGRSSNGEQQ